MKCLCTRYIHCSLSAQGHAQIKYPCGTTSLCISQLGFVPSRQIQSVMFLLTENNFRPICSSSKRPFLRLCKSARITLSFALFSLPFLAHCGVQVYILYLNFQFFSSLSSGLLFCALPSYALMNTCSDWHLFLLFLSFCCRRIWFCILSVVCFSSTFFFCFSAWFLSELSNSCYWNIMNLCLILRLLKSFHHGTEILPLQYKGGRNFCCLWSICSLERTLSSPAPSDFLKH